MSDGYTKLYFDPEIKKEIESTLVDIAIDSVQQKKIDGESYDSFYFDHSDSYSEKKFSKAIKELIKKIDGKFFRARHYDEYGTEVYWLNDNGKYKRYLHEVDSENSNIVKAYSHWHSSMGGHWDGHFDKDDIQRISERFGSYDENGKATKNKIENFSNVVTSSEKFFGKNIKAAYAHGKFDIHVPVLQSYAGIMVAKSQFIPGDNLIKYERSFIVKDAYDSDVIGFVWSWNFEDCLMHLVISWYGGLAVKAKIVANQENITIDEAIYAAVFSDFLKKEVVGSTKWINTGIEQIVWPPSLEYAWNDSECDRDKYYAQSIVLQFTNIEIFKSELGNYIATYNDRDLFEIDNTEFTSEIDAIGDEKFLNASNKRALEKEAPDHKPKICIDIQVRFCGKDRVNHVSYVAIFNSEKNKPIYERSDPISKEWLVPNLP